MIKDNDLKEYMFKEIDIIEDTIKRMAINSFLIKGGAITLIIATFLLGNIYTILAVLIPLFAFWYLDAYFLRQERAYRKLYAWTIENRLNNNNEKLLDMNAGLRFGQDIEPKIMLSKTLTIFYGALLLMIVVYTLPFLFTT